MLANRLKLIIPRIVGDGQVCGVHGKSIFHNLFILRDIILSSNYTQKVAILNILLNKKISKLIHSEIYKYMWQGNIYKISFGQLFLEKENDGLEIINIHWKAFARLNKGIFNIQK